MTSSLASPWTKFRTSDAAGSIERSFGSVNRWIPCLFFAFATVKYCWTIKICVERGGVESVIACGLISMCIEAVYRIICMRRDAIKHCVY